MPPKKTKDGDKATGGRKTIRNTTVKGKGKGKHGKKHKPGTPMKDEIDDLFPSFEKRFPLDPGETIVNPDFETAYYHTNHNENSSIAPIDFQTQLYNLPLVMGARGQATVHAGRHGIVGSHDPIPHAQQNMEAGAISWVPTGENVKTEEIKFSTQKDKQALYDPATHWKYQPEWVQWSSKYPRDLSRLTAPRLPYDLTRMDRRAISRCFQMIKQDFVPVPLPKEAAVRKKVVLPPADGAQLGGEGIRPHTPQEVMEALTLGAAEAIEGGEEKKGGDEEKEGGGEMEDRGPRMTRRGRERRDGSVGRPKTPPEEVNVDRENSISMVELFHHLRDRGERFETERLLKDPTKSTFLQHLIRTHFPALPNGRLSMRLKQLVDSGGGKMSSKAIMAAAQAVPKFAVKKLEYQIDRCNKELEHLQMDESAKEHESEEVMTRKIKFMDELEETNRPMTLHEACKVGEIDVVAEILSPENAPSLINYKDSEGSTPLEISIKSQQLHLVRYMLAACRADPNQVGVEGNTPLHVAAMVGNLDIVVLLCNYGGEPTATNCYGETTLHLASRQGNGDVVECLILYGAHVDVQTTKGKYTPLMFAAGAGMTDAIKHLMDHGANKDIRNAFYENAVIRAAKAKEEEAVSAIVNWTQGDGGKHSRKGKKGGKGRTSSMTSGKGVGKRTSTVAKKRS
ncbi:hypothetical protein TrST_g5912 [Triparma strigata]|uniref:Ankyrin repeat protein n=1 Tax=Triparma strigata TaxID=1606541 RepID=A0A9W7AVL4_9STRA|nr:hypothetical protein TrST_g5912 [Triparma strigata]